MCEPNFDDLGGERGSGQPAPHETQQGADTPGQGASSAAGNVAEPHCIPEGHRDADPPKSPPLGRDIGWAVSDDETRPIREVLNDRKRKSSALDKRTREAAFKERAKMQAVLMSCLCNFPLEVCDTESKHAAWCPSEGIHRSFKRVAEVEAARERGELPK